MCFYKKKEMHKTGNRAKPNVYWEFTMAVSYLQRLDPLEISEKQLQYFIS